MIFPAQIGVEKNLKKLFSEFAHSELFKKILKIFWVFLHESPPLKLHININKKSCFFREVGRRLSGQRGHSLQLLQLIFLYL